MPVQQIDEPESLHGGVARAHGLQAGGRLAAIFAQEVEDAALHCVFVRRHAQREDVLAREDAQPPQEVACERREGVRAGGLQYLQDRLAVVDDLARGARLGELHTGIDEQLAGAEEASEEREGAVVELRRGGGPGGGERIDGGLHGVRQLRAVLGDEALLVGRVVLGARGVQVPALHEGHEVRKLGPYVDRAGGGLFVRQPGGVPGGHVAGHLGRQLEIDPYALAMLQCGKRGLTGNELSRTENAEVARIRARGRGRSSRSCPCR